MNKSAVLIVTTGLSVLLLVFLVFTIYERNEILRNYKRDVFGAREDYKKLKSEYEQYMEKTKNRKVTVLTNNTQSKNVKVGDIANTYASKVKGDLSIYYKNLITGESVVIDGEKSYNMASLYKVILTIYILDEVKEGRLKLDDKVGDITIEEALNKIITESNNEYAQQLAETYGWDTIAKAMRAKLGIDFRLNENLTANVTNIGTLFEDIALSLKITDVESEYLLKLLKDQTKTSKLPKYLPKNIYSHNKTGEVDGYSHDAGIFYTPKANYILIFMSNTASPGDTNEQMALMSKEIYEMLNDVTVAHVDNTTAQ